MSGAPSEADSEDTPEFQEQVQKLQKTWEVASLAQFFRTIGPYIPRAICPHSDLLEYELVKGVEEYLVGLMLPLLGLDEDADSDACWAKIQELQQHGIFDTAGVELPNPMTSFQHLEPVARGKLLYAIANCTDMDMDHTTEGLANLALSTNTGDDE